MRETRSDLPPKSGVLNRLHHLAGNFAITVVNLFRPRLTLGVRLAAFDREGRIFLVRHSYVPGFYLPGGGVELGETCRQAVMREAEEEGGLEFERPPELYNVYRNDGLARRDHVVLFVARNVRLREEATHTGGEILDAGFYPPDALPEAATKATLARIAEIRRGPATTDDW
ncbi:NUDIX domain-containing protein [Amaricoccus macauensis]|uniref:NUDIX domain-containing protein n=1 Tax=Amaricoccus macauensis TaxID=57001 RepID=UPI003C7B55FD